jgi:DNA-directed RNA polymerase subunit RPC12/RpoP
MFMNCPDCGLKVRLVAPYLLLERCPRCLVHRRLIVEMRVTTDRPSDASAPASLMHNAG